MVAESIRKGVPIDKIYDITKIDKLFLYKIENLINIENDLKSGLTGENTYRRKNGLYRRRYRAAERGKDKNRLYASYKLVDTCAPNSRRQRRIITQHSTKARSTENQRQKILVLGSGPIRIGQGIEFDYCSVHSVWALRKEGYETIIANCNPETVSTDFDTADRLYFDPLTPEDIGHIVNAEKPDGAIVQFGGQTAIKLTKTLVRLGVPIMGTSEESIDAAEDRENSIKY